MKDIRPSDTHTLHYNTCPAEGGKPQMFLFPDPVGDLLCLAQGHCGKPYLQHVTEQVHVSENS